jgi:hypothetical protein
MKILESFLSKKRFWILFRLRNFQFFSVNILHEIPIKQTHDPAEKGIPMDDTMSFQCYHPAQLLPLLISLSKFFTPLIAEKQDNQFKGIVSYPAIPGPVEVNST